MWGWLAHQARTILTKVVFFASHQSNARKIFPNPRSTRNTFMPKDEEEAECRASKDCIKVAKTPAYRHSSPPIKLKKSRLRVSITWKLQMYGHYKHLIFWSNIEKCKQLFRAAGFGSFCRLWPRSGSLEIVFETFPWIVRLYAISEAHKQYSLLDTRFNYMFDFGTKMISIKK